jgi:hypothetical protein
MMTREQWDVLPEDVRWQLFESHCRSIEEKEGAPITIQITHSVPPTMNTALVDALGESAARRVMGRLLDTMGAR